MLTTHKLNDVEDEDIGSILTAVMLYAPKTMEILNGMTTMTTYMNALRLKYKFGERYVQPLVERMMESGGWAKLGTLIGQDCDEKWSRILGSWYVDYNPLNDYERHEEMEGSENGESSESRKARTTTTLDQTTGNKFYGFNSATAVPVSDTDVDSTSITSGTANDNNISRENEVTKGHEINITGRGVSASKLLDEETRYRLNNFIEIIHRDIADYLCVMVY